MFLFSIVQKLSVYFILNVLPLIATSTHVGHSDEIGSGFVRSITNFLDLILYNKLYQILYSVSPKRLSNSKASLSGDLRESQVR